MKPQIIKIRPSITIFFSIMLLLVGFMLMWSVLYSIFTAGRVLIFETFQISSIDPIAIGPIMLPFILFESLTINSDKLVHRFLWKKKF